MHNGLGTVYYRIFVTQEICNLAGGIAEQGRKGDHVDVGQGIAQDGTQPGVSSHAWPAGTNGTSGVRGPALSADGTSDVEGIKKIGRVYLAAKVDATIL
jgi:hypothetical protein